MVRARFAGTPAALRSAHSSTLVPSGSATRRSAAKRPLRTRETSDVPPPTFATGYGFRIHLLYAKQTGMSVPPKYRNFFTTQASDTSLRTVFLLYRRKWPSCSS